MKRLVMVLMMVMAVFTIPAFGAEYSLNLQTYSVDLSTALDDGWVLDKYYNDNADIYQGEYLRANPTDGRAYFWKNITPPVDTTAIIVEYDAVIQYSYWSQNTGIYIVMSNGVQFMFGSGMRGRDDDPDLHKFFINRGGENLIYEGIDLHYGVYHFTVIFAEEEISVQAENSDGDIIYNATVSAPGLHPAGVTQLKYWVYTTTDHNSWMKNLEYGFIHHEKVE